MEEPAATIRSVATAAALIAPLARANGSYITIASRSTAPIVRLTPTITRAAPDRPREPRSASATKECISSIPRHSDLVALPDASATSSYPKRPRVAGENPLRNRFGTMGSVAARKRIPPMM
jgi:hypothetical protein